MDFRSRTLPIWAVFRHDLGALASTWLLRIWLGITGLVVLLQTTTLWGQAGDAKFIAFILFPYLILWFLIVMMLGVGPVAGNRGETLADSILSRPVTRYEYLFASWAARVFMVLSVFLVVVVPAILLVVSADRPAQDDPVAIYGILAALLVVSLVLILQVSLAFLLGTLLRRQMVAVAVLAFGWFVAMGFFNTFQMEELSPLSLSQALPSLLRQSWNEHEAPPEVSEAEKFADIFKQMGLGGAEKKKEQPFLDSHDYEDVTLWRVTLGYGLPTLLSIILATIVFCRRDL